MADIIIVAVLAAVVCLILRGQVNRLRRGECGGCPGCSGGGGCPSCGRRPAGQGADPAGKAE